MALFEEGVGPDRISDMTTNVILGDLLQFNTRVMAELRVPGKAIQLRLRNGKSFDAVLPVNPHLQDGGPIILVPADVLRDLPVATDWSEVADAASKNDELRNRVNAQIARMWEVKSRKDKGELRRWALSSKDAFESFLDMIHGASPRPYDMAGDPLGEVFWRKLAATLADQVPLTITRPAVMDHAAVVGVVEQIIEQFRFLIVSVRSDRYRFQRQGSRSSTLVIL